MKNRKGLLYFILFHIAATGIGFSFLELATWQKLKGNYLFGLSGILSFGYVTTRCKKSGGKQPHCFCSSIY